MKIQTLRWTREHHWQPALSSEAPAPQLVLGFGAREVLAREDGPWSEVLAHFPATPCAACSTAGEILDGRVSDGGLVLVVIRFSDTRVRAEAIDVTGAGAGFAAAAELSRRLAAPDLRHVLVLSDGLHVNGTALTAGFRASLPAGVSVTGGLAGDGPDFRETLAGLGLDLAPRRLVALGLYGDRLRVAHGSAGGWEPFGPRRLVTRSAAHVLYTLDDRPALALYQRYLGERAAGLPATGLLFPLQLLPARDAADGLVRTILGVDEAAQSLTFAGDIPEGHYVRLMKAGPAALVDGARLAAAAAGDATGADRLALLVSCVGRRLVLGQRAEEEIEAVRMRLGEGVCAAGFYSYGEISPAGRQPGCDLHNQTMTLTVLSETV